MLLAHQERFRRVYADARGRPSGDHAELLRRGSSTPTAITDASRRTGDLASVEDSAFAA
jgi:hypothetical protein